MGKKMFANPAFDREAPHGGFNLISQVNTFNSVFDQRPLDPKLSEAIDQLICDAGGPKEASEGDARVLKELTSEVIAIEKQGVLLIGERIHKARELLKKYGDGQRSFSGWLTLTFKQVRSAYNALSYFELYMQLPTLELKTRLKTMPQKAVYVLAQRSGPLEEKLAIVEQYFNRRADEIIGLVQEKFPSSHKKRRKGTCDLLLRMIEGNIHQIQRSSKELSEGDRTRISLLIGKMELILARE